MLRFVLPLRISELAVGYPCSRGPALPGWPAGNFQFFSSSQESMFCRHSLHSSYSRGACMSLPFGPRLRLWRRRSKFKIRRKGKSPLLQACLNHSQVSSERSLSNWACKQQQPLLISGGPLQFPKHMWSLNSPYVVGEKAGWRCFGSAWMYKLERNSNKTQAFCLQV